MTDNGKGSARRPGENSTKFEQEYDRIFKKNKTNPIKGFAGEYRFLSNFWPSPIKYKHRLLGKDVVVFPTVEHAFQAMKSLDPEVWKMMAKIETPGQAKRQGRKLDMRTDWDRVKFDIMLKLVTAKFEDKELAAKLIATGDAYLEETNTWNDTCWGVCNGTGLNRLGETLMKVRSKLVNA